MALQIGEASVVLTNWGASKVSGLIKDKAVLAGWTVYDSGGAGADPTDKTTGAYWWVLKHPADNFYVFLTDRYEKRTNYYHRASFFVYVEIGNDWNTTTNVWNTGSGSDMQTVTVTATGYKYLICRIHQRHYWAGSNNCSGVPAYATSFGTTYNSWGLRTNL